MNHNTFFEDMSRVVGIILLVLVAIAIATALLYIVVGEISDAGRRWLCVLLIYAVFGALAIGVQIGRAYRSGYEASLTRSAPHETPVATRPYPIDNGPLERLPALPRVFDTAEAEAIMKYLEDNHA